MTARLRHWWRHWQFDIDAFMFGTLVVMGCVFLVTLAAFLLFAPWR